ncbi:large subunit ribosomal protein L13e [Strigomonas culicis]|uniref:Large subunit ribosomal protein L13e n=1 Tax=Strigomonas culicis TaxID=28005 RepID=S9VU54_9TRYP|nr:large subunit ribosomal protein L13e [Strigomonas culicis]|eukprot:EPY30671.1 large subunit ribosomal protein L13e [Strigomonas culicis]
MLTIEERSPPQTHAHMHIYCCDSPISTCLFPLPSPSSFTSSKMPKGNNAIPHVHQKKHWNPCSSQKGNVKTFLNQPAQKARRRRLRLVKAKRVFPRPVKALRPQVNCPTVRYNMKKRLGRGFSPSELKAAGLKPRYARTIGISVDLRRRNKSEEGLNANVQRLKTYLSKLVLFPLSRKKVQQGEASEEAIKAATQDRSRFGDAAVGALVYPAAEAPRAVSADEKSKNVYKFLKKNHSAVRFFGARTARAARKAAAAAEKAGK